MTGEVCFLSLTPCLFCQVCVSVYFVSCFLLPLPPALPLSFPIDRVLSLAGINVLTHPHQLVWLTRFGAHYCLPYDLSIRFVSLYVLLMGSSFSYYPFCLEKGPWPNSLKGPHALCPHTLAYMTARDWCSYSDKRCYGNFKGFEIKILSLRHIWMVRLPVMHCLSRWNGFSFPMLWMQFLISDNCGEDRLLAMFWSHSCV